MIKNYFLFFISKILLLRYKRIIKITLFILNYKNMILKRKIIIKSKYNIYISYKIK